MLMATQSSKGRQSSSPPGTTSPFGPPGTLRTGGTQSFWPPGTLWTGRTQSFRPSRYPGDWPDSVLLPPITLWTGGTQSFQSPRCPEDGVLENDSNWRENRLESRGLVLCTLTAFAILRVRARSGSVTETAPEVCTKTAGCYIDTLRGEHTHRCMLLPSCKRQRT